MALTDKQIVDWILSCRNEAEEAKRERMAKNRDNYDMFHMRHDFSHKEEGQSTEILAKQSKGVEQIKSFFQQALADLGEWWRAESCYPDREEGMLVRPHEITKLTSRKLEEANYYSHVGNSIETALLASVVCSKTFSCLKPKPKFVARKKGRGKGLKRWVEKIDEQTLELKFSIVRAENYYPDPNGDLYEIEDAWPDLHDLLRLAEEDSDYDLALIKTTPKSDMRDVEENFGRAEEAGQNTTSSGHRPRPKVTEFWGTILDPHTGEVEYENCQAIIMNDTHLIMKPRPNPLWHQRRPYTASPLTEVANSKWHKAVMDAPTLHNRALIEMYNLMVDAAMKQVHAVSQLRKDALDNPAQVQNGIKPGQTLLVNSMLPVGGKVLEPLTQVQIPPDAFNIYSIMEREFVSSAYSSEAREGMTALPNQKATAVVEASQTITSMFQGMAKNYEGRQSVKELELAWMTVAQNWDRIAKEELVALFGPERGEALSQLSPEDVFASTVNGVRFRVFGVTQTLNKAQDFRKLTTLLQTIAASPALMEEYLKKYDLGRTLGEVMTSLDIDKHKLEIPQAVQMTMQAPEGATEQPGSDMMSQVPQAGGPESIAEMMGGGMPQTQFPGSPALIGGNQQ